jgi:hypothetical protein
MMNNSDELFMVQLAWLFFKDSEDEAGPRMA